MREREKEGCKVGSEMTLYEAGSWVTMGFSSPTLLNVNSKLSSLGGVRGEVKTHTQSSGILS